MNTVRAGVPTDMETSEKFRGMGEALIGGTLVTSTFWTPWLDHLITGAHVVAAVTGAVVGLHGVWRILRNRESNG